MVAMPKTICRAKTANKNGARWRTSLRKIWAGGNRGDEVAQTARVSNIRTDLKHVTGRACAAHLAKSLLRCKNLARACFGHAKDVLQLCEMFQL